MTSDRETTSADDLVARSRSGDREAWEQLFAGSAERALLYIRLRLGKRLRERLDSVDVLHEAWLDAWKALDSFRPQGDRAFERWLCRIIENKIRGLADHHFAGKRVPPGEAEHVSMVLERAGIDQTGPLTRAVRGEREERLFAVLGRLNDEEREALLLRHFQERTIDEIAEDLGKSPTSTRRLLARATAEVGRLLGEDDSA